MTKPHCYHSLDQVRDSGLLSPARMEAVIAEIESRISEPQTSTGQPITTAKLALFPDGTLMLYPRMDHDPEGAYIRRELMSAILTAEELKLINDYASSASREAADARHFEAATKLTSWDGWVTDGDRYWNSVETYLDERCDELEDGEDDTSVPYLWVAVPQQVIPHLDAGDITEHWICDRGYEDMDLDAFDGVKELQAALDAFVELNKGVISYSVDPKRAVLLTDYLAAKKRMDEADEECNRTGIHPIHQR